MRLTSENTAVVLDSASDFPEAAQLYPNFRVVPLYVRFGDESFKDYVEIGPDRFYERLGTTTVQPTTSQPTPGDFLAVYEEVSAELRADRFAAALVDAVRDVRECADRRRDARRRPGARDRHAHRLRGDRDARDRASAAGSSPGRPTRRSTRSSRAYQREHHLLFTVSTLEYLQRGGRIGRAAALAGQPAQRQADPHDPRR